MSNKSTESGTSALKAAMTGQVTKTDNPARAFQQLLESRKAQIASALPKHLTADRVIRLALSEFTKNQKLQECTPQSIYLSIIQASQLGLEIGVLGQAYLVPYNNKVKDKDTGKERWQLEAQFIPGYKGLISLARRSGEVQSIETHIVYDNDEFSLSLGLVTEVKHIPNLNDARGKPRLVYGVAHFKDGGHHFEWMAINEVEKIRARSKAKDSGPWVSDYEQMVRKTVIRRMANYLPMSIELAAALEIDAQVSAGNAASIDGDFQVIANENAQPAEDLQEPTRDRGPVSIEDRKGEGEIPIQGAATKEASTIDGDFSKVPEQQGAKTEPDTKGAAKKSNAPPPLSYAFVSDLINKARTGDEVDDILSSSIPRVQDPAQREELITMAKSAKEKL